MKRQILMWSLLAPVALWSQSILLDTATVSTSLLPSTLVDANRQVIVLSQDEIEALPAQSIGELLDFAIGIDARQRGPFDVQTDLSIRGSSFEQVLVMVNGIRMSDPQTGHHLMNLPVAKEDIERIEILLGGNSASFGSGAFAGSINIITKSAEANHSRIRASAGSNEAYELGFSQTLVGEDYNTALGIHTAAHNGYAYNTDAENHNVYLQHKHRLGREQLNLNAGYNRKAFGAQSFYSTAYPEQFERTQTLFTSLGLSRESENYSLKREVYWRRHWDEFQLFREGEGFYQFDEGRFIKGSDTAAAWYTGHNFHRSDVLGGRLHAQFKSRFGKSAVVGEYRMESVVSNQLGEPLDGPIDIAASRGQYVNGASRENTSIGLEHQFKLGAFSVSAGLLYNRNTDFDESNGLYPSLNVGYGLSKNHRLFANVNRSFRLPSYTDLYYRLGGAQGSIDLKPEQSLNLELGYKLRLGAHFAQLALFRREGNNLIDWVSYTDSVGIFAANITEVNINGMDASYRLSVWETPLGTLEFLELGYSYYFADSTDSEDFESLYVLDFLRHKLSLRMSYDLTEEVELFAYGSNLLGEAYVDRGNVLLPGAWLWAGFELRL